jgi:uncharacterized membrane protein (UPF0127 family)
MADALRLCLAGLTLLLLCGCPEGEHSTIRVGNHEISVEVAADNATRRRGLMERESMPPDHGMLFIFPHEKVLGFWMKNTPLPLSIAYADKQGTIVRIADLEPHSTDGVSSIRPALYALEMNRGWFKKNGVIEGDRLRKLPKVDVR